MKSRDIPKWSSPLFALSQSPKPKSVANQGIPSHLLAARLFPLISAYLTSLPEHRLCDRIESPGSWRGQSHLMSFCCNFCRVSLGWLTEDDGLSTPPPHNIM